MDFLTDKITIIYLGFDTSLQFIKGIVNIPFILTNATIQAES